MIPSQLRFLIIVWSCFWSSVALSETYAPFEGLQTGWYFNIKHPESNKGPSHFRQSPEHAIDVKGPFISQFVCQQQLSSPKTPCYASETADYMRWKAKTRQAWVIPLQTRDHSKPLVFNSKEACHRVATEGFFYNSLQQKTMITRDLRRCLYVLVTFEEWAHRYSHESQHPQSQKPFPKSYKAWSLPVEHGRFSRLLQFSGTGDMPQKICLFMQEQQHYFRTTSSGLRGYLIKQHLFPKNSCQKRAPFAGEIPITYQHLGRHSPTQKKIRPQEQPQKKLWVLIIKKGRSPFPLYFETQSQCQEILRDGFYYSYVRRGLFEDQPIRSPFEMVRGDCTQVTVAANKPISAHPQSHYEGI